MVKIIFIIIGIILGLNFLFGFIIYGFGLAELKYENDKELLNLGLSREALEFKPESKDPIFKIITFFICLFFSGYVVFTEYIGENLNIKFSNFKGFSLW